MVIRDLGYFNLSNFSKIVNKKAYFLSRLSKSVNVYLNKSDEQPLNLIEYLEKLGVKALAVKCDMAKKDDIDNFGSLTWMRSAARKAFSTLL